MQLKGMALSPGGVWNSGNQFYVYNHGGGIEND
jgi:hypothetical protein